MSPMENFGKLKAAKATPGVGLHKVPAYTIKSQKSQLRMKGLKNFRLLQIGCVSRVPDQNGMSQACYIVKIYHSGPEPSILW